MAFVYHDVINHLDQWQCLLAVTSHPGCDSVGEIAIQISVIEKEMRASLPKENRPKYTGGNNVVKMIMTERFKEIASDEDDANGETI